MEQSLAGRRILITRTRGQASQLAVLLEEHGAETILIPTIEVAPPVSWSSVDAALASLSSFDWCLFTSANAVRAFAGRAAELGVAMKPQRVAAIGPATAREAEANGLKPDLIPPAFVAESLAAALLPHARGSSMLLVRAAEARDVLPAMLTAGGASLTIASAYRNVVPSGAVETLRELFRDPAQWPDAITFTSSSTAVNLSGLLREAGLTLDASVVLASIGPVTSATLCELEHPPQIEAAEATIAGLVHSICEYFSK